MRKVIVTAMLVLILASCGNEQRVAEGEEYTHELIAYRFIKCRYDFIFRRNCLSEQLQGRFKSLEKCEEKLELYRFMFQDRLDTPKDNWICEVR